MPAMRARSSLRRSWPPAGVVAALCVILAAAPVPAAAMPRPDPPPSAVAPDPPPDAAKPTAARAPQVQAPQPAVAAPLARRQQPPARQATPRPKAKPKRQVVVTQAVIRDSAPMPRRLSSPAVEALERGLLVTAGLALAVVALGGAVVLGASRRALAGARA